MLKARGAMITCKIEEYVMKEMDFKVMSIYIGFEGEIFLNYTLKSHNQINYLNL